MLISHSRRFLFVHIYKNAGTSITEALKPFAVKEWPRGTRWFFERLKIHPPNAQPYKDHITASELVEKMGKKAFKSFFSFAIVRNPWDWQVSLYNYMLKEVSHHSHEFIKKLGSFDKYVEWRVSESVKLQKDFVYSKDGELLVDFIGRFETLERDFQVIGSRIGISASLPKLNSSNSKPYQEYYNQKTRKLVGDAFRTDISLFSYDFADGNRVEKNQ